MPVFRDVEELITAIGNYIDHHNQNPKPFIWIEPSADHPLGYVMSTFQHALLDPRQGHIHTVDKKEQVNSGDQ